MTLAWFDCSAGASGDMLLGALLDAGASLEAVQAAVAAVDADQVSLEVRTVSRHGLRAAKADVRTAADPRPRTWSDLRRLLEGAVLAEPVRVAALRVFTALAEAEGRIHGVPADDVHFHEVGALDSIADVVGTCAALHDLGVTQVFASPVAVGSGSVRSEHGRLPVPVPAVVALLAAAGAPVTPGAAPVELCTPTGAAVLAALCEGFGPLPAMTLQASGTGAGTRELDQAANVVRVLLGSPTADAPAPSSAVVLEATVDDLDPRLWPEVLARLLDAGAADAWLVPVLMKKGRPGHVLSVLARPARLPALREVVFRETTTLGLREHAVDKHELARDFVVVHVDGVRVAVKRGWLAGEVVTATPEHADVLAASAALDRPVKDVLAAAQAAYAAAVEAEAYAGS
ncbi:hypothetical protein CLV35_3798 [Motilibacter peucedani]|uniref:Pyridinium-3,5-bisthiocarboxylic acid mononucleotide nickel insertion protein n=1 Tax=Motilibacter peucedani TaxID=598650 RepID=A0A420XJI9_9ACTN|nr:nickel pincer cofactor biosynthesis protein LarC [Motilibacter peucedani]RKS67894.1 hypothetical protein CLV35_3798 [Motilibacter peucedani]